METLFINYDPGGNHISRFSAVRPCCDNLFDIKYRGGSNLVGILQPHMIWNIIRVERDSISKKGRVHSGQNSSIGFFDDVGVMPGSAGFWEMEILETGPRPVDPQLIHEICVEYYLTYISRPITT